MGLFKSPYILINVYFYSAVIKSENKNIYNVTKDEFIDFK